MKANVNGMKWCPKCKKEKHISDFNKNKHEKDGFSTYCKDCHHYIGKIYRAKNPPTPEQVEKTRVGCLKRRQENREHYAEYNRNYQRERRKDPVKYEEQRSRNEFNFVFLKIMRGLPISQHLQNKFVRMTGKLPYELVKYFETMWLKDYGYAINWDDRNETTDYHKRIELDHIIPLRSFNLLNPIEYQQAWNYCNLRMRIAHENRGR